MRLHAFAPFRERSNSAVVLAHGKWYYIAMVVPDSVWDQLLPRRDEQIMMQEFLAIPMLLATFSGILQSNLLMLAVDNQSVLGAMTSGSSGADDLNTGIGKTWLEVASQSISLHLVRVESKANVADGPSRDDLSYLEEMDAQFVEPVLPDWARTLWRWPSL